MPNPTGSNGMTPQPQYGDVKKLQALTTSAPLAGTSPALGAPRRAQRKAVKRQSSAPAQQQQMAPPAQPAPSYEAQLRVIWQELLAHRPDDPLFNYYAQKT
jgi:hypothetical protein